jgi:hypothetical protein
MSAIANKVGNERQLAQIDGETGRYLGEGFDDAHLNSAAAVQPASSSPPPNLRQRCDHLTVQASTCVYRKPKLARNGDGVRRARHVNKAPPLHGAVEARARVRKSQSTVINAFYEYLIA